MAQVARTLALPQGLSYARRWVQWYRYRRMPIVPTAILMVFVVMAIFADIIAPYDPVAQDLSAVFVPPWFMEGGSTAHPLGTDLYGRDILSRIAFGARISLSVSVLSIAFAATVGTIIGMIAGYKGGVVDTVIMRIVDGFLTFPTILLALLLAAAMGASFWIVVFVMLLILWSRFARLVRGDTLSWKQRDFVALARISGCSTFRILVKHIFPQVVNSIVVLATLQLATVVLTESVLSFLGAGVPPPTPSWGNIVAEGRNYIRVAWWSVMIPGACITLLVLSANLFGDWLRDYLDPKLRQI